MQDAVQHVERLRQYLLRVRDKSAEKQSDLTDSVITKATPSDTKDEQSASTAAKDTSSDTTQQQQQCVLTLQQKLSEAHAQIAALQASEMQKEVELQCVQAAKALLMQSEQSLSTRCKQLETSLATTQDTLHAAQRDVQAKAEQQDMMQRQMTLLQEELRQYEEEFGGLQLNVEALQHRTETLCTTNVTLREKLEVSRAKIKEVAQLNRVKAQLESRVAELEAALEGSNERWSGVEAYFTGLKEELTQYRTRQKLQEEEHSAMAEALKACEEVNARWQDRFTASHLNSEKEVSVVIPVKEEEEEEEKDTATHTVIEDSEEHEESTTDMTALVHSLEAKTVDLAIALHSAEQRAEVAERRAEHIMLMAENDIAAWLTLRATLALVRPMAEEKACEGKVGMRATLIASEHFIESLCAIHVELLEAYTDEMLHSVQLEAQLAALTHTPATTITNGGSTAVAQITLRKGATRKRQALSYAALQEMRQRAVPT